VWDIQAELMAGECPYPDGYSLIKDRIAHVHVKPNARGTLDTVGDTQISYAAILSELHGSGFSGAASIEHWGSGEAMLSGVRQLRSVVDALG
jgi:sugar phosphate isomerase/epimerase